MSLERSPAPPPELSAGRVGELATVRDEPQNPAVRDELTARAESFARGARAGSTWAAYDRQRARFETWCAAVGERALPADPLTVVRFLADFAPVWRPATPADPPGR